jgi:CBS domain containing-hemolysin-like protein
MLADTSPTPTLLLFLVIVGVGGAAAALVAAVSASGQREPWEAIAIAPIAAFVMVVLAVTAHAAAAARPEATALWLGRPIWALGSIGLIAIAPLLWLERRIHGWLAPRRDPNGNGSEEDLRLLVESVEDARKLEADEREMISGIFGMSSRPVREVMVPRIDVIHTPRESTLGTILDQVVSTGYSRIPIVSESIDNVVGVVYAKDVLRALRAGALEDPAEPIARAAYFVPDTKKVDELLQDLQQKRVHMAIVVDEYGGTAGIVTIEDLLEEIVGEIRDEYDDNEEIPIERIDDRECVVDARVSIRDLNEALDVHLDVEELDTLGGLVYHELGKVPIEGDEVRVNGCLVTVLTTQGRRIKKLRVQIVDDEARQE